MSELIGWRTSGRSIFGWHRRGEPIFAADTDPDGLAVIVAEPGHQIHARRPSRHERKKLGLPGRRTLVIEMSTGRPVVAGQPCRREIYIATRVRILVGRAARVAVGAGPW